MDAGHLSPAADVLIANFNPLLGVEEAKVDRRPASQLGRDVVLGSRISTSSTLATFKTMWSCS
jgi:hypothetical protein